MPLKMDSMEGSLWKDDKGIEVIPSLRSSTDPIADLLPENYDSKGPEFVRERNLLLLSVLYYLYGDEWNQSPDWAKVVETIESKKIPTYGENFTAASCEVQYRALIEKGYQVGVGSIKTTLGAPKSFSDSEKRRYILANTSNDLVLTSKLLEKRMQEVYETHEREMEELSDKMVEHLIKLGESDSSETESNPSLDFELTEYEDPEVEKAAIEIAYDEMLQDMVGLKDVLPLVKYCTDAVDHALKNLPQLLNSKKNSSNSEIVKNERKVDYTKNTISNIPVSQELTDLVHSALEGTKEDEKVKSPTSTPPAPTLAKLLELPVITPGMPLPEISSVKPNDASPQKNASRPTTRGRSKDRTVKESPDDEIIVPIVLEVPTAKKEENDTTVTNAAPASLTTPKIETNGGESETPIVAVADEAISDKIEKTPDEKNDNKSQDEKKEDGETKVVDDETTDINHCKSPTKNAHLNDVSVVLEQLSDSQTEISNNENVTPTRCEQPETPTKGKTSPRKGSGPTRPITTRTSSRLTSPEPTPEQSITDDEKQVKKALSRQTSNSETHIPNLRSRRGATPTKAVTVEKEPIKSSSSSNTKPDVVLPEEKKVEECESSRTSPETTEVKSDQEVVPETKPKLRVYSARPPSPLSHVDEFPDFSEEEEDPELAAIDNNVNKTRDDKTSSKASPRKGRTCSSENDVANTDENSHSKRLTRNSLRIHDAVTEAAAADESNDASHAGHGSEKAGSESSFGGKEKKSRGSKSMMRVKKLNEEKHQLFGDADSEEGSDGKRLTRARAKTGPSVPEKRTKLPSVGDSESLSETEPTPTRSTRSRVSTTPAMPTLDVSSSPQATALSDEEDNKAFRKNSLNLLNKISNHKSAVAIQKYLTEDASKILKHPMDFQTIRRKIETGATKSFTTIQKDLSQLLCNVLIANASAAQINEQASEFMTSYKACLEETINQRNNSNQKNEESDDESVDSQDEQKSEKESAPKPSGGRRKRRRSASETSIEDVFPLENKRRVTRTSASSSYQQVNRKTKHPISPDIVSANRTKRGEYFVLRNMSELETSQLIKSLLSRVLRVSVSRHKFT